MTAPPEIPKLRVNTNVVCVTLIPSASEKASRRSWCATGIAPDSEERHTLLVNVKPETPGVNGAALAAADWLQRFGRGAQLDGNAILSGDSYYFTVRDCEVLTPHEAIARLTRMADEAGYADKARYVTELVTDGWPTRAMFLKVYLRVPDARFSDGYRLDHIRTFHPPIED